MAGVRITGKVRLGGGTPAVVGGWLTARLSRSASASDGRVLGGGTGRPIQVQIGADGSIDITLDANDALVPSGTYWDVQVQAKLDGGGTYAPPSERWQVPSGPDLDIGAVPRLTDVPGVALVHAEAVSEAAAAAQALATASAAAAAGSAGEADAAQAAVESGTAQIVPTDAATPRELKSFGTHIITPHAPGAATGRNVVANPDQNTIAGDVHTSTITGGGAPGFPQRIGSTAGSNASYATIGGGYDNTNDQIAGTIAGGAHHNLAATGTHGTIGGGSYHTIGAGVEYAVIPGGTANSITGAGDLGSIGGGQNNSVTGPGCVIGGGTGNTNAGNVAVIGGGNTNTIATTNGAGSVIAGGTQNHVDGTGAGYNSIGGGTANAITGVTKGTIAGGATNTVTGNLGTVCGGDTNSSTAAGAAVVCGFSNTASGQYSTVINGQQSQATSDYSTVVGLRGKATLYGQQVLAGGYFAAVGDAEAFQLIMRRVTTDAAASSMALDGAGALAVMPDNTTWTFDVMITARNVAANEHAGYRLLGVIKRDVGAATTAIVGTVMTPIEIAETVAGWNVTATADTTSGDLRIRVTGEAGKTIRWVAHARIVSVSQ